MFYCICCKCVHATSDLPLRESRQRCSGNERCYGAYAHGVARSHCRVLYHIRRGEITVRMKSNPPRNLPRNHHRTLQNAVVGNSAAKIAAPAPTNPLLLIMVYVPFLVVGEILLYMLCSCWPWSPPARVQSLARMSGMLDLSSDENAKHFLPRWFSDAPTWMSVALSMMRKRSWNLSDTLTVS